MDWLGDIGGIGDVITWGILLLFSSFIEFHANVTTMQSLYNIRPEDKKCGDDSDSSSSSSDDGNKEGGRDEDESDQIEEMEEQLEIAELGDLANEEVKRKSCRHDPNTLLKLLKMHINFRYTTQQIWQVYFLYIFRCLNCYNKCKKGNSSYEDFHENYEKGCEQLDIDFNMRHFVTQLRINEFKTKKSKRSARKLKAKMKLRRLATLTSPKPPVIHGRDCFEIPK